PAVAGMLNVNGRTADHQAPRGLAARGPHPLLAPADVAGYIRRMSETDTRIAEIVELVRRVRHDANNPLTAALGHVQLLIDDPAAQDPDVQDSLNTVESELRRMMEILRRLNEIGKE